MIAALEARVNALGQELEALRRERQAYENDALELDVKLSRNRRELVGYLLPDLDDDDLLRLERRLRYPALRPIKRDYEARLAAVESARRELEKVPEFVEREVRIVDIETQLAEIAEPAQSFRKDREPWESSANFQALLGRGWFEDGYDAGLFDWLRDWRACSLLMEELEQKTGKPFPDDDDVRGRWRALAAASEPVFALEARLGADRKRIEALVARHAELTRAPDELHRELWVALAEAINHHLESCPDALLVELGSGDPALAAFLKKAAGLKAQASYLREVVKTRVDGLIRDFEAERQKLRQKRDKLSYKRARGKYVVITNEQLSAARTLPRDKWEKRRLALAKTRTRIADFEAWDRGAYVTDYLWWDLITKNDPGRDLLAVRAFREAHPNWVLASWVDPLGHGHDRAADSVDLAADQTADQLADAMAGADSDDLFDAS